MGFRTLTFTTDTFPVPNEWIFEKFLNLEEKLTGQSVSIKSIFNSKDSRPSMVLYIHDTGKYKFKDFSSGIQGDAVDLLRHYYNISREDAFIKAYDLYKASGETEFIRDEYAPVTKSVSNYVVRKWNTLDAKYWTDYKISSDLLTQYNVKPLESYNFSIEQNNNTNVMVFQSEYCYGFFRNNGELYKIYNPKNKKTKFVKVKNYIQGHDQLEFKSKWLIILSSLKDLMAFKLLGFKNIECIAPDSENTMLTEKQIEFYKKRYDLINILFDNDVAGKESARKYKEQFDLPIIPFEVEKDLAECIKQHGIENTKVFLKPLLIIASNEYKASRKTN
jgi:hypothetical protein